MKYKMISIIKNSYVALSVFDLYRYIRNKYLINDEKCIVKKYKKIFKSDLNFNNPKTFNEKLQWLKLNIRDNNHTKLVDKFSVRKYIEDTIGDEYLIPLIEVYDEFNQINFGTLPESFILKCTHNSGGVIVCKDKENLDLKKSKKIINRCLRNNYYYLSREWPYKNVKPRIVCEKLLIDENGELPKDYKFFCFNGEPKLVQVDIDRFAEHKQNFYDADWNFRDVRIHCENDKNIVIEKPQNYEKMIEICKKLSKDIPHVRVDLYNVNGKIFFGELTFFHMSGFAKFKDEHLNYEMGNWIEL